MFHLDNQGDFMPLIFYINGRYIQKDKPHVLKTVSTCKKSVERRDYTECRPVGKRQSQRFYLDLRSQ